MHINISGLGLGKHRSPCLFMFSYAHVCVCKCTSCATVPSLLYVGNGWGWTGFYHSAHYLLRQGYKTWISPSWLAAESWGICLSLHHSTVVTDVCHRTQLLFCGYWEILTWILVRAVHSEHFTHYAIFPIPRHLFKVGVGDKNPTY